ncbi:MAG: outer membrane beta-barrel protein [Bacteroidetes bacterium]|jgi:opacity protein-like surface antigen|nr:outer membrane beta-barrel protein [Bacteroidota bacterium]
MKRFLALITILFLGFSLNSYSQEIQGQLDFGVGIPQGDFRQQSDHIGGGLNIMGGYRFPNSPVMLGLEFGFMNFGTDTREEALSSTIPDLRVEVENSYNLAHGDILLRLIAPPSQIRPYVDGLFGFNYFFTETVIRDRDDFFDEEKLSDTNFEDTALSYGFGAGLQIRVWQNRGEVTRSPEDIEPSSVYINLRGRYMFGREAEYLQKGSISTDNGRVTYDVTQSTTNLLHIKIGVGINF